ncbi:hypothetical protein R3W88_023154 [Solanum pinnatisectum]|uniref:Uncharacterized protein n=1 Tax=Solanum pinnatisectum TaxID=50273 RepID=A0AAV9LWN5_9SOLN|nr:hypothetical protein R3W88_023154 [Solanum pinnatisectum]
MSQSPSSSKKMLEIDPVAFYTFSNASSPSKMLTISTVNIGETSPLNPQSPLDLHNPAPELGPYLPKNKLSESNILATSGSLVVESLTQMRGGILSEKGEQFVDNLLGVSQPMLDQTPEFGVYPLSNSTDTDEDTRPFRWIVQNKMVPIPTKEKEKVIEETPKRRPFTRSDSKKLMGDAMKLGNVLFKIPDTDVVDVSIEDSEHEGVEKGSEEKGEKQVKKPSKRYSQGKGKSKASVAKRIVSKKGKNKRKRETTPAIKPAPGTGHGPMGNEDDHGESKQSIVNNLRLKKVLEGRVFDPDIITKHGMNSLYDIVEIQSWTHLFQTKSPVLHEEEVREFYYNIEFEKDGSLNTG